MPSGGTRRVPGERRPQSCYHCRTPPTGVDDIESSGRKLAAAWLRTLATVLFVAAVPVFLIAGSVRMVINAPALYSYGFDRYDIPAYTGIEREDLLEVAARIRAYFNDDSEYLIVPTTMRGVDVPSLYNEREILHMRDVKGLVRGVYAVHEATGLYLLAFGAFGLALNRRPFLARLARYAGYGGGLTLGIVLLAGDRVAGGLRQTVPGLSPRQLRQRPLAARPAPRLPDSDVPAGVLLRRHHAHRHSRRQCRRRYSWLVAMAAALARGGWRAPSAESE